MRTAGGMHAVMLHLQTDQLTELLHADEGMRRGANVDKFAPSKEKLVKEINKKNPHRFGSAQPLGRRRECVTT